MRKKFTELFPMEQAERSNRTRDFFDKTESARQRYSAKKNQKQIKRESTKITKDIRRENQEVGALTRVSVEGVLGKIQSTKRKEREEML